MTSFDETTELVPDPMHPGRSTAQLHESWSSLRGVHGGYLTALTVRAAEARLGDRAVRTVAMGFLRPATVGPATVSLRSQRESRSFSTFEATIEQDERAVAVARITAVVPVVGESWDEGDTLGLPPVEACEPLAPPEGIRHFEQAEAVLDPAHRPFSHQRLAIVRGYVRPRPRRPIDAAWLAMILDWFPPSPFTRVDPPTGGVSIDYTVHLHRTLEPLNAGEWLGGEFRAEVSQAGMALERGRLVDGSGRLVAESFHTRWTG